MTTQEQKQERIVNVKNLRPEKIQKSLLLQAFLEKNMAGVAGFEPAHTRIKTWCLTAWRYPKYLDDSYFNTLLK